MPFFLNEVHPKPVPSSGSLLSGHSRSLLVGSAYAKSVASSVALFTGVPEIAKLVQPTLSRQLAWYKNTRPEAAWCPLCFSDWAKNGLPIFRPLLWSFASVRCCPIHHVFLRERCPGCSRTFNHFASCSWPLLCPECGRALSEKENRSGNNDEVPGAYESFCGPAVADLLAWGLGRTLEHVQPGCFATNIRNAIAELGSEYTLGELTRISRPVIHTWRNGQRRPVLPALLRLSYCFDVPVHHWISQEIEPSIFGRGNAIARSFSMTGLYSCRPTANSIEKAILAYLARPTAPPISVRELADRIGAHSCRLYEICPKLVRKVVARRARAVAQRKERVATGRVHMVRRAIAEIEATGRLPSRNAVLGLLKERGAKCSWLLKEVFRSEMRGAASEPRQQSASL